MTLTTYARPLRSKPVAEITTQDVLAVLRPLWSRVPKQRRGSEAESQIARSCRRSASVACSAGAQRTGGEFERIRHERALWIAVAVAENSTRSPSSELICGGNADETASAFIFSVIDRSVSERLAVSAALRASLRSVP